MATARRNSLEQAKPMASCWRFVSRSFKAAATDLDLGKRVEWTGLELEIFRRQHSLADQWSCAMVMVQVRTRSLDTVVDCLRTLVSQGEKIIITALKLTHAAASFRQAVFTSS